MKVREIMTTALYTCRRDTNLGEATRLMWMGNCGFLPVLGIDGRVCGVITDRDICIALGTRNKLPGNVSVGEVASSKVYSCSPDEEIHAVLLTMRHGRVRRLPVVDADGKPVGVLSMDDILMHAEATSSGQVVDLSAEEVVRTFRGIPNRHLPQSVKRHRKAA
jgi:CBS domain-containing protein